MNIQNYNEVCHFCTCYFSNVIVFTLYNSHFSVDLEAIWNSTHYSGLWCVAIEDNEIAAGKDN